MNDSASIKWAVGDVVSLKKPHPCGGFEWEIMRIGMDFRIRCITCQRQIMLSRADFVKRVKKVVKKAE
ncbi:MAG: DUF951 domain-containing protein [Clostridia bacterium]|nr:DUF951 domain-containing protein [Clostridia bacterium]MDD4571209.1 DUF951 domain-containing protein [Clostridia bacterium]